MLFTVGMAATTLTACGGQSCAEREAVGYSEMAAMVRSTMDGIDYTMERGGLCEESGDPVTVVRVTVRDWPNRRVAHRYLERRSWVRYDGPGALESPDGAYWANAATSSRAGESGTFVTLDFFEHADDADQP